MKRVACIALILLLFAALGVPVSRADSSDYDYYIVYVYVSETGDKYHDAGCIYVSESCYSTSLESAKLNGYEPCSKCLPDDASGWRAHLNDGDVRAWSNMPTAETSHAPANTTTAVSSAAESIGDTSVHQNIPYRNFIIGAVVSCIAILLAVFVFLFRIRKKPRN